MSRAGCRETTWWQSDNGVEGDTWSREARDRAAAGVQGSAGGSQRSAGEKPQNGLGRQIGSGGQGKEVGDRYQDFGQLSQ